MRPRSEAPSFDSFSAVSGYCSSSSIACAFYTEAIFELIGVARTAVVILLCGCTTSIPLLRMRLSWEEVSSSMYMLSYVFLGKLCFYFFLSLLDLLGTESDSYEIDTSYTFY